MAKTLVGVLAVILGLASAVDAQYRRTPFDTCGTCRQQVSGCGCGQRHAVAPPPRRVVSAPPVQYAPPPQAVCAQPQPVYVLPPQVTCVQPQPVVQTHTQLRPVVETQYRQEQYTVYKDIPRIDYRVEQQAVTVPVTTYRQVTVDEGRYQQVWVPKLVSKAVPQTAYQQQMVCRTVPVQTTQRVAEMATRNVPFQSVKYVPQTYQTVSMQPPACNTCLPTTAFGTGYPYSPIPQSAAIAPTYNSYDSGATADNSNLWTKIRSRHDQSDALDEDDAPSSREQRRDMRSSKRFTAPTAARLWQANSLVR
ncbi:MAG: hypothetical protein O2955_18585 [Planctomycetota bacterium]|nr:hypothetical protein [Planctomycetota bacterium]MDA1214521.1 hypothetical protein [Planctomycetota bacterium]